MLLILTNSADETANYLISRLSTSDIPYFRMDTDRIVGRSLIEYRVGAPQFKIGDRLLSPEEISNVWYRRPEVLKAEFHTGSPEEKYAIDEWTDALEGVLAHIPVKNWINHPIYNSQASKKLEQLTLARRLGFKVPDTLVTQDERELKKFFQDCGGTMIIKPLSSGLLKKMTGEDSALIYTSLVGEKDLEDLGNLKHCPSFFQALVPKATDVRITVIDGLINAVVLNSKDSAGIQICDIRVDNMEGVQYQKIDLPEAIRTKIIRLVDHYRLRFAAIDMAITESGEWVFFEINPNGQWAWLDIVGGQDIAANFIESFTKGK